MNLESKPIVFSLAPATIRIVMRGLGKLPYEEVAGLIHALSAEVEAQQRELPPPVDPSPAEPALDESTTVILPRRMRKKR